MTSFRLRGSSSHCLSATHHSLLRTPERCRRRSSSTRSTTTRPGTDATEFLELKNVSGSAIPLNGWTVELFNGASTVSAVYQTIPLPDVSLAAGDYFVVCANATLTASCDLDVNAGDEPHPERRHRTQSAYAMRGPSSTRSATEGNSAAPYTEGLGRRARRPSGYRGRAASRAAWMAPTPTKTTSTSARP